MKIIEDSDKITGYFIATKPSLSITKEDGATNTIIISNINLTFSSALIDKSVSIGNTILQTVNIS